MIDWKRLGHGVSIMKNPPSVFCGLLFVGLASPWIVASAVSADRVRLRSIGADAATGLARAVVVEEGALVHTALMFPEDGEGRLHGEGDAATQATRVLANIESGPEGGTHQSDESCALARLRGRCISDAADRSTAPATLSQGDKASRDVCRDGDAAARRAGDDGCDCGDRLAHRPGKAVAADRRTHFRSGPSGPRMSPSSRKGLS